MRFQTNTVASENLEAISFLKEFNEAVYKKFPDVQTIAEESTAFSGVSSPTMGGFGFRHEMDDGLDERYVEVFSRRSVNRKYHHHQITFSTDYAFTENFMLPLSHDEVVHGK